MKRPILAAVAALMLSGCVTATPYQPATKHTDAEGYTEQRLQDDRWRVTFSGNEVTSRQTVDSYMLYRAAELTLDSGFDWFETVDRSTEAQVSYDWGPDGYYYGAGWYGPYGYGGYGNPRWTYDNDWNAGTAYQIQANIIMHHGPKPKGEPHAFDAREVIAHLNPHILRPKEAPHSSGLAGR
jgi:hypothetical protein